MKATTTIIIDVSDQSNLLCGVSDQINLLPDESGQ
jgi:hypothetical protein